MRKSEGDMNGRFRMSVYGNRMSAAMPSVTTAAPAYAPSSPLVPLASSGSTSAGSVATQTMT